MRHQERPKFRYRRVSVQVWHDEKFVELSAAPPNAQTLWFWLLTGPLTLAVPGLVPCGLATMAERLHWPLKATEKAFREIEGSGMARADWRGPLVWLPRGIRHNPPESPNVVRSWRKVIDTDVPASPLVREAEASILAFLEGMGEPFAKAFREGIRGDMPESGSGSGSGSTPPLPPSSRGARPPTRTELSQAKALLEAWQRERAPWDPQAAERHRLACERLGEPIPPPEFYDGGPRCWHEPVCASVELCLGRIVAEQRVSVARGMSLATEGAHA